MKLEVGEWYLTRDGRKVFIEDDEGGHYRMKGYFQGAPSEKYSWDSEGRFYKGFAHPYDLLHKLPNPFTEFRLEVGKWYLTRDGKKAFVERYDDSEELYCVFGRIENAPDDEYSWTIDGAFYYKSADDWDLVEELETATEIEPKQEIEKLIEAFEEVSGAVKPTIILKMSKAITICPICGEQTIGAFHSVLRMIHKENCPIHTLTELKQKHLKQ